MNRAGEIVANKYQLVRQLGSGGFGAVYEAQHTFLRRRFAIKLLHADLMSEASIIARFEREARAAGALENENIAAVTDFGVLDDGTPYIVMEFLEGEDLAVILERCKALDVARAVRVVVQACRGVDAAHSRGIVHRDLKPGNLFVCRRGDGTDLVKVLDFGIAKLRLGEGEGAEATRSGATLGTSYYMPPEQARGEKTLDHRADIYSLGVILFESLSGERPHPGDSYNAVLFHILTKPPILLGSLRPGLPAGLVQAVHRAIHHDPQERFASVADFAMAIAPYAAMRDDGFAPPLASAPLDPGNTTRHGSKAPVPDVDPPTPASTSRASTSRTKWAIGAVIMLSLGGAAAAYVRAGATPEGSSPVATDHAPSDRASAKAAEVPKSGLPHVQQSAAIAPPPGEAAPRSSATRDMPVHATPATSTSRPAAAVRVQRSAAAVSITKTPPEVARTPPEPRVAPTAPSSAPPTRPGYDRSNPYAE